jgi:hypothetical protein
MIRRALAGRGYRVSITVLVVAICVVAGYLAVVALPDLTGTTANRAAASEATPTPEPTAGSAMALSPIGIQIPPNSDCGACHLTDAGAVGTKPIPKLGHPLWGFRDCTACHKPDGLVQTAPGHSSLHKDDCLVCHQVPATTGSDGSVAPMRPEHMGVSQPCTSCHGVDEHAPLPADMQGRDSCWICHNGPEFQYLFESPEASPVPSPQASPEPAAAVRGVTTP